MSEVYGFLAKGGPIMIPIMLGSIIGLAIFFERMWFLRQSNIIPDSFVDKILILLKANKRSEAIQLCNATEKPISRIIKPVLEEGEICAEEAEKLLEDSGKHASVELGRYLEALGTIASIEPLLGLLGTVTGLIRTFQQVVYSSGHGAVDPGKLATGIWEALITTAAGLVIAIPCYIAYKYLSGRVDHFTLKLEEGAFKLLNYIKYHGARSVNEKEENKKASEDEN